jgi:hypothetical protein
MHHRSFEIAAVLLLAATGCATTTWTLTGECIGPEVESEEYEAYALYLREHVTEEPIAIQRHTLIERRFSQADLAELPEAERRKLRDAEDAETLRAFVHDAGPEWQQAAASYEERSADGGGCLAQLPRRSSEPTRAAAGRQTVTFSRVGFDAAKNVAIFKVELSGSPGRCAAGRIVRLVKTPDEGWIVLESEDWNA